jgi:hypothetical protein
MPSPRAAVCDARQIGCPCRRCRASAKSRARRSARCVYAAFTSTRLAAMSMPSYVTVTAVRRGGCCTNCRIDVARRDGGRIGAPTAGNAGRGRRRQALRSRSRCALRHSRSRRQLKRGRAGKALGFKLERCREPHALASPGRIRRFRTIPERRIPPKPYDRQARDNARISEGRQHVGDGKVAPRHHVYCGA